MRPNCLRMFKTYWHSTVRSFATSANLNSLIKNFYVPLTNVQFIFTMSCTMCFLFSSFYLVNHTYYSTLFDYSKSVSLSQLLCWSEHRSSFIDKILSSNHSFTQKNSQVYTVTLSTGTCNQEKTVFAAHFCIRLKIFIKKLMIFGSCFFFLYCSRWSPFYTDFIFFYALHRVN